MKIYTVTNVRKRNLTAAERELERQWQQILAASSKPLERGATAKGVKPTGPKVTVLATSPHLSAADRKTVAATLPSVGNNLGTAPKRETMKYTGTKMIGLGQLHKSNTVPVFQQDDAIDIARMRRG